MLAPTRRLRRLRFMRSVSCSSTAAELAIEQAAKKLVISAETDRLLVQDFARRLGSDDLKGGQN